jgi:flagellar M-ring protein FliF
VKEAGEIKRLAVSVAVDGKWTPGANGAAPTYAARTPAEIEQIKALVSAAVGIDLERGDKIEVLNTRFNRDLAVAGGEEVKSSLFDFTKNDLMRGVELLVLLITGILLIFFVLRPLLKSAWAAGAAAPCSSRAALPGGGSVTSLQTTTVGGAARLCTS